MTIKKKNIQKLNKKRKMRKGLEKTVKRPWETLFKIKPSKSIKILAKKAKPVKQTKPQKPAKPKIKPKVKSKKRLEKKPQSRVPERAKQIELPVCRTRIKVIGIGGGGSSIVNALVSKIKGIDFIVANTDTQALKMARRKAKRFSFGHSITHGLGTGMDPKLGEESAESDRDKIKRLLEGTDLCFLVSCLGGGTGGGASPVFVETAKDLGILTIGIFTLPFDFEGKARREIAEKSLKNLLKENIDAVAIILNQSIFQIINKETYFREALRMINRNIYESLQGVLEMVSLPGLINVDFADLKTILERQGELVYLQTKEAGGKDRAEEVVKEILSNPLYDYTAEGATGFLFNITGGKNLNMQEVEQIGRKLTHSIGPRAEVIFGVRQEEKYKGKIKVTLVACGCQKKKEENGKGLEGGKKSKETPKLFEKIKEGKESDELAAEKAREAEEEEFEIPTFLRKKMGFPHKKTEEK